MKIKRTTWHYKLYCFTQTFWKKDGPFFLWEYIRGQSKPISFQPTSLCPYFWSIVLSCLVIPFITLLMAIILMIAFPCYYLAIAISWPFKRMTKNRKLAKKDDIRQGVLTIKEPSLVTSFIKAKKSKVCPIIEIVD